MTKKTPFWMELAIGVVLSGFFAWAYASRLPLLETVSLRTFDSLLRFRPAAPKSNNIHIVEIDEGAVNQLGRWPWPRSLLAQLIDDVAAGGADVIGLNVLLTDPDENGAAKDLDRLYSHFSGVLARLKPMMAKRRVPTADLDSFQQELATTRDSMNGDQMLGEYIEQSVNVVLPMYFQPGESLSAKLPALPPYFDRERLGLPVMKQKGPAVPEAEGLVLPLAAFGKSALAVGHANLTPDIDGTLRRMTPLFKYGADYFPSFGLQVVREHLKFQRKALGFDPARGLTLDKVSIPLTPEGDVLIDFSGPKSFPHTSALDVLSGGVPDKAFAGKIVLIGVTAPGTTPASVVPGGGTMTGLEVWATHIANILSQRFITRPPWSERAEWGFLLFGAIIAALALPLFRLRLSVPFALIAMAGMIAASAFLLVKKGIWISPSYGCLLIVSSFLAIVARRSIFTERGKEMVEAEGVETNKMLGLSFQGQGMLDLAFEKFRRCPVDGSVKELLYNLGLDMERKRMFSKAAAVYEHIAANDSNYKDIREKIELLKKAGEGAVFGTLGKKGSDATVVVDGLGQNTTLGRYEVMRELGRGAMGIVYLGKDPKINRQVAIKTLRFEDDVDPEQAASIKERFFREAESAGNLTHPNIIRIFDAGEDQDVAYIAMELIDGEDLKKRCERKNLLPFEKAVELVAQVASGLDYAHKQGVVHRDIKPGNIMLLKDGTLRITDFGIARIQATSKTATGAVLGTPAYMSPEQVNGKKVDGRADIFSLGVTLFELLTGEKPFYADTIAALLYRIANVDHPDPREFNPALPAAIVPVLNKALAKDPDQRYQTAGEMAADLQSILRGETPKNAGRTAVSTPKEKAAPAVAASSTSLPPAPSEKVPESPKPASPESPSRIAEAPKIGAPETPVLHAEAPLPSLPQESKPLPPAKNPAPSMPTFDSIGAFETPENEIPSNEDAPAAPAAEADFLSQLASIDNPLDLPKPASSAPAEMLGAPAVETPAAPPAAPTSPPPPSASASNPFEILRPDEDSHANDPFYAGGATKAGEVAPATELPAIPPQVASLSVPAVQAETRPAQVAPAPSEPSVESAARVANTEDAFLSELENTFKITPSPADSATSADYVPVIETPSTLPPTPEALRIVDAAPIGEPTQPSLGAPQPSDDTAAAPPALDKTLVIPPPSGIEKTVVFEPGRFEQPPILPEIEPTIRPPIPKSVSNPDAPDGTDGRADLS